MTKPHILLDGSSYFVAYAGAFSVLVYSSVTLLHTVAYSALLRNWRDNNNDNNNNNNNNRKLFAVIMWLSLIVFASGVLLICCAWYRSTNMNMYVYFLDL